MSYSLAQTYDKTSNVTTGSPATATFTATTTSGNAIIVICAVLGASGTAGTITDNYGNTYQLIKSIYTANSTDGPLQIDVFYADGITGGASHTLTAAYTTTSGKAAIILMEYSGLRGSSALDQSTSSIGSTGSAADPGGITTGSGNLVLGILGMPVEGLSGYAPASPFVTEVHANADPGYAALYVADAESSGAALDPTWSWSGSGVWGALAVSFNLPGAGGGSGAADGATILLGTF